MKCLRFIEWRFSCAILVKIDDLPAKQSVREGNCRSMGSLRRRCLYEYESFPIIGQVSTVAIGHLCDRAGFFSLGIYENF